MGKSFLLRDAQRRVCGYCIQGMDGWLLRLCDAADGKRACCAVLFGENGAMNTHEISDTTREQTLRCADVAAIAVAEEGGVLCASDEQTMGRAAAMLRRKKREMPESERKSAGEPSSGEEDDSRGLGRSERYPAQETEQVEKGVPQRRWPPPPCVPYARYAHGRWMPSDEGTDS